MEAQRVCAGLRKRGYSVTVLCAGAPAMPDTAWWTDPYGVPVRIFARGFSGALRDYWFALAVAWTLWSERHNYRLVYFHMPGLHLAFGLPLAQLLGKPVIMKIPGSGILTAMRHSFLGRLELGCLRRWARRIMILNSDMEKEALDAGLPKQILYWMPNPVDTDEFAPATPDERASLRHKFEIPLDVPLVLYVGRLAPEKRLPSLLKAFARTAERVPEARLVLVGDGPEGEKLKQIVERLDLSCRVRLAGRKPGAEVHLWLQAGDVFALVSANEGFSCALSEAMATGLPSVVSAIAANLQLVDDGVHGLHFPVGDEDSLTAALTTLLSNPRLRAEMGKASRQRILDHYSMDKILRLYEALFDDALG